MTKTEAGLIMAVLREAYPGFYKSKTKEDAVTAVNLWWDMFKEYPYELVEAAVKAHIATDVKGYPPVIGQILDQVRKITQPEYMTEFEAWALVKQALKRSGYYYREEFDKLPKTIQKVVYVPEQLRDWAFDEHFNEAVVSSNFMRAYREVVKRETEYNAMPEDVRRLADQMANCFALPETGV